ncbi:MAG: beta-ketoacyl-ACP synthase II, partial [Gemmatimonadetes bacterium]|nr:beta-ketoacyl-ACP synthase II [Gemmatimonadota bacterium]
MGALAPNGNDLSSFWDALINGRSGIGQITRFDTTDFRVTIAGELKNFDPESVLDRKEARRNDPFVHYGVYVAQQAFDDAGIDISAVDAERVGVIFGSGIGGVGTLESQNAVLLEKGPNKISPFLVPMMICDMSAGMISIKLGAKGPNYTTVSACASAAHAIGEAARKIQYGDADIMVTGGTEAAVTPVSISGFAAARALAIRNDEPERASRPFDSDRNGFVMGEGAGALVLEEYEHARARGAQIYAEFKGLGFTADAYHITDMAPEGEGGQRAMRLALKDGGLNPEDIGYVNAHGTSTLVGDTQETAAIKGVFGEHAKSVAVSSTKSMTGHLLGAAGA